MSDQKNPRNSGNPLYKALTRLFSGPLVDFRDQAQNRYRRGEMNKLGSKFTSASGKAFKKAGHNPYDYINTTLLQNQNRNERYLDFDQMEFTPELASALDIYSDEMTTFNDFRNMLNIECDNEEIKSILTTLFYDVLNIEMNMYSWCRTMCKYGDLFMYLDIDESLGIKSVTALPTQEVERIEGQDKTNPNYIQFQWNAAGLTFENWQIAHFRILGQDKYAPYGTSVLEPARRIWRQLIMIEDAMMAYRMVRSAERRVFYIDMGGIPPNEYEQHVERVKTQMKRNQVVDASSGRVDLRYNPMSIEEDYYIPVRGGQSGTKIETLQGGQFTAIIDDVKYLRDKLFSAIKIPQAYLARGEGASEDKSTLAQKDIRYARTVQRLQKVFTTELLKIGIIHLYILGYRNTDLVKFSLHLNNPSKLSELQELEHFKARMDAAEAAKSVGYNKHWIFKNIFKVSDDSFVQIQNGLIYDKHFEATLEKVGVEGGEEGNGGGAGGALGDILGGGGETETPEAGAEEEAPEAETPEAPEETETPEEATTGEPEGSPLLAAPAKREDGKYSKHTTAGSKGKEYQYKVDDGRSRGARTQSTKMSYKPETGTKRANGATSRSINLGYNQIKQLHNMFNPLEETKDVHKDQERLLLEIEQVVNNLSKKLGR